MSCGCAQCSPAIHTRFTCTRLGNTGWEDEVKIPPFREQMVSPDPHTDAVGSVNVNEPVNLMNPKSTATRNAIVRHRSPAGEHTCRRRLAVLRPCAASTPHHPLSHRWKRKGKAPVNRLP